MRRLKRHTSLATILRSPSPAVNRRSITFAGSEALSHPASVAKAYIIPTASSLSLPAGYVNEPQLTLGNDLALTLPPSQQQPSAISATAPSLNEASPLTPSPTVASSQPIEAAGLANMSAEAPDADSVWRRLQTILHRHEQKQAAEHAGNEPTVQLTPTSLSPQIEAAITQPEPVEQKTENHKKNTHTLPTIPASPAEIIQRQVGMPAPHPLPSQPLAPAQTIQTQPIQPAEARGPAIPSDLPTQITQRIPGPDALLSRSGTPDREAVPPDLLTPASEALLQPAPPTPLGFTANQDAAVIQGDQPRDTSPNPDDTTEAPVQLRPLEAAWPVQPSRLIQREVVPPLTNEAQIEPLQRRDIPSQDMETGAEANGTIAMRNTRLHQILQEVIPGQPTESPVETLPPRQPRPNPTPPAGAANLSLASEPPTTVQRQTVLELQTPSSEMIPTDIGPLPSDLWRLVGHAAPVPELSPEKAVRAEKAPSEEAISPTASPTLASGPAQLPIPIQDQAEMPTLIQRQVEKPASDQAETAKPPATAVKSSQPGAESAAGNASAGINLDELTRKVYNEVRRRLAIERERIRR